MYTTITIGQTEAEENQIAVPQTIYNERTGKHEVIFTEYMSEEKANSLSIPQREEKPSGLDMSKVAEAAAWSAQISSDLSE